MADTTGPLLVRAGLITQAQLQAAYDAQRRQGGGVPEHLVAAGAIDEELLCRFFHERLMVPRVAADQLARVSPRAIAAVPADMAVEFRVVPVELDREGNLIVAMQDPSDTHAVDELGFFTGTSVLRLVAPASVIAWALHRFYGAETPLLGRGAPPATPAEPAPRARRDQPDPAATRPLRPAASAPPSHGAVHEPPAVDSIPADHATTLRGHPAGPAPGAAGHGTPADTTLPGLPVAPTPATPAPAAPAPAAPPPAAPAPATPVPAAPASAAPPPATPAPATPTPATPAPAAPAPAAPPKGRKPQIEIVAVDPDPEPEPAPLPRRQPAEIVEDVYGEDTPIPVPVPFDLPTGALTLPSSEALAAAPPPAPVVRQESTTSREADHALHRVLQALEYAADRDAVAEALVGYLGALCRRAALFVVKKGVLAGWLGMGLGVREDALLSAALPLDVPSTMQDVVRTRLPYRGPLADSRTRAFVTAALGWAPPEMLALPITVRTKVVSVLYGDERQHPVPDEHLARVAEAAGEALERALAMKKL